jgi:hypothetical protein
MMYKTIATSLPRLVLSRTKDMPCKDLVQHIRMQPVLTRKSTDGLGRFSKSSDIPLHSVHNVVDRVQQLGHLI